MKDGTLFTVDFRLPDDAKNGDLYPLCINYESANGSRDELACPDQIINESRSNLIDAWLWMYGCTNGYIKVVSDLYWNQHDNKEIPYRDSFSEINPDDVDLDTVDSSEVKAKMWVEKVTVDESAAGTAVPVSVYISGAENQSNSLAMHLGYDSRLTVLPKADNNYKLFRLDDALSGFLADARQCSGSAIYFEAVASGNDMKDGSLFTVGFKLPKDAKNGDLYPVCIIYGIEPGVSNDIFGCQVTDADTERSSNLMNAWLWMNGCTNGYIKVGSDSGAGILSGDANLDGKVSIADAVLVMQAVSNKDEYGVGGSNEYALTQEGHEAADCYDPGSDITSMDALAIQQNLVGLISLPLVIQ